MLFPQASFRLIAFIDNVRELQATGCEAMRRLWHGLLIPRLSLLLFYYQQVLSEM
jgi:hypothetical protein